MERLAKVKGDRGRQGETLENQGRPGETWRNQGRLGESEEMRDLERKTIAHIYKGVIDRQIDGRTYLETW